MEKLTRKEEEIMQVVWQLGSCFVKDVIERLPDPKPHYNTVSTIIRKMEEKGYIAHRDYGGSYEYYPAVPMEEYRKKFMNKVIDNFFDKSYKNVVSFFAREEKISVEELKEIIRMIEQTADRKDDRAKNE